MQYNKHRKTQETYREHETHKGDMRKSLKKSEKNVFLKMGILSKFDYLGDFSQDLLFMYKGVFFTFKSITTPPINFAEIKLSHPKFSRK